MANSLNKITTKSILDATVATADIADDAVTADKLANAINTDIAAKAVLTGSTNNTITTVTGANAIQGEANLTFDGGALSQTIDANDEGINITAAGNHSARFKIDSNQSGADDTIFHLSGRWNSTEVASIHYRAGADTTNKDDGRLTFHTTPSGGSLTERLRITEDGNIDIPDNGDVRLGTGNDFKLEHNGSHSYVTNNTGSLFLRSDNQIYLQDTDGNKMITCVDGGAVELYHNGDNKKIETTSTGVNVTGGIRVGGNNAANELDDYEEGTWTPTLTRSSGTVSVSYNGQSGKYTKIGNCVMMWFDLTVTSQSGGSGTWRMSVPFTFVTGGSHAGHGAAQFRDSSFLGRLNMARSSAYIEPTYLGLVHIDSNGDEVANSGNSSGRLTGMVWAYTS